MSGQRIRVSVVVPVYGNEGSIPALIERLTEIADRFAGQVEAILVVDGSPDASGPLLQRYLATAPFPATLIWHSRNFGSFSAIRTGLEAASGGVIAVMAADLQEPPELIIAFLERLLSGRCDVVIGARTARQDPFASRALSTMFWRLYRTLINPEVPVGGVDTFGCTRDVADVLVRFGESHSSLIGLLFWVGFRRESVPYARLARAGGGSSGWSVRKKRTYMMDSVYSFTDFPISVMKAVGVVGVALSCLVGLVVLWARLTGSITVPGYSALMLAFLMLGSLNLLGLGVVGSYVWRTYENSKARPHSVVMWREHYGSPR